MATFKLYCKEYPKQIVYLRTDWDRFDHLGKALSRALDVRDLKTVAFDVTLKGRAIVSLMNGFLKVMVRIVEMQRRTAYKTTRRGARPDKSKYFLDANAVKGDRLIVALNAARSLCIFCLAEKSALVVGRASNHVVLS